MVVGEAVGMAQFVHDKPVVGDQVYLLTLPVLKTRDHLFKVSMFVPRVSLIFNFQFPVSCAFLKIFQAATPPSG